MRSVAGRQDSIRRLRLGLLGLTALLITVALAPAQASGAYRDVVLADFPDSYFRMDDTGSPTMDNQTAGANGTHVTSATGPTFGLGGALSSETPNLSVGYLNSENDHSTFPMTTYDAFTIEFWVFSPEPTPAASVDLWYEGKGLVDGDISTVQNDVGVALVRDGHVGFGMGNQSTSTEVMTESTTAVNGGAWHYVVATSDGAGAMKLYVDGVLEDQDNSAPAADRQNTEFSIGRLRFPLGTDGQVAGALDEVAFYRFPLAQATITEHYLAAVFPPPPPCRKVECLTPAERQKVQDFFSSFAGSIGNMVSGIGKGNPAKPVTVKADAVFPGLFKMDWSWAHRLPKGKGASAAKTRLVQLGKAETSVGQPGPFVATFTFSKAAVKLLRKTAKANLTATASFTDEAGGIISSKTAHRYKRKKK